MFAGWTWDAGPDSTRSLLSGASAKAVAPWAWTSARQCSSARQASAEAGASHLAFCQADAENLPLKSGAIDIALVNGIFNLNPAREAVFAELARVVRAGGSVYAAGIILREPSPAAEVCTTYDNWFA